MKVRKNKDIDQILQNIETISRHQELFYNIKITSVNQENQDWWTPKGNNSLASFCAQQFLKHCEYPWLNPRIYGISNNSLRIKSHKFSKMSQGKIKNISSAFSQFHARAFKQKQNILICWRNFSKIL